MNQWHEQEQRYRRQHDGDPWILVGTSRCRLNCPLGSHRENTDVGINCEESHQRSYLRPPKHQGKNTPDDQRARRQHCTLIQQKEDAEAGDSTRQQHHRVPHCKRVKRGVSLECGRVHRHVRSLAKGKLCNSGKTSIIPSFFLAAATTITETHPAKGTAT